VCSALPGAPVFVDYQTGILRREGTAEAEVALAGELYGRLMRYALARTGYDSLVALAEQVADRPWRSRFLRAAVPAREARYWDGWSAMLVVDPREHYARLRIPTLVVLGERDDRILVDKHRTVFEALRRDSVPLDLWVVPEASHGLMLGPGNSAGYPPGLHERLAHWVAGAAGVRAR
jgi:pimeloyl-ACP methyl ester carboxylesterase